MCNISVCMMKTAKLVPSWEAYDLGHRFCVIYATNAFMVLYTVVSYV